MRKRYFLSLSAVVCFLLMSLFLQSCGGSGNLPIEGEEEPTETIEQTGGRLEIVRIEDKAGAGEQANNTLPTLMPELWQYIFSYLDFEGVLAARAVNSDWNELITGFRQAGVIGVENKPQHIVDTRGWTSEKKIYFKSDKLSQITPSTIPSFAFYYLMGHVKSLRRKFWPYLQGTNVHMVNLMGNQVSNEEAEAFAKHLQGTNVHTVDLGRNEIGDEGAAGFAKHLQGTQVHTVDLSDNRIGDQSAELFAKHLQGTQVHTVDLKWNYMRRPNVRRLLVEQYPYIKWRFY